jgi:hypothetical protein
MSSESTPDMQKQANKDDMVRLLNTFFNPVAFDRTIVSPSASPTKKALLHAGGLSVGYGGLAFLLRKLHKLKESEMLGINQELSKKDTAAYTAGKYPTLSIDPDVSDIDEEKALKERLLLGGGDVSEQKQANSSFVADGISGATGQFLHDISSKEHDSAHLALATAAVFAATAGGWRLADYLEDAERRSRLDVSIADTKNKVDKMIYDEYKRVKGAPGQKVAGDGVFASEITSQIPSSRDTLTSPSRYPKAFANFYWLWAAFAFAFSYKAMRSFSDKNDPSRKRMSELKKLMSHRQKMTESPVLLDASQLPVPAKVSDTGAVQASAKPSPTSMSAAAVKSADAPKLPAELGVSESDDLYTELMGA